MKNLVLLVIILMATAVQAQIKVGASVGYNSIAQVQYQKTLDVGGNVIDNVGVAGGISYGTKSNLGLLASIDMEFTKVPIVLGVEYGTAFKNIVSEYQYIPVYNSYIGYRYNNFTFLARAGYGFGVGAYYSF